MSGRWYRAYETPDGRLITHVIRVRDIVEVRSGYPDSPDIFTTYDAENPSGNVEKAQQVITDAMASIGAKRLHDSVVIDRMIERDEQAKK